MRRLGILALVVASLIVAGSLTLMTTGSSILVAEHATAPGLGRIEYVVGRDDLPRSGWRLECTYFTGRSLAKTHIELTRCGPPVQNCPVQSCPLIAQEKREAPR